MTENLRCQATGPTKKPAGQVWFPNPQRIAPSAVFAPRRATVQAIDRDNPKKVNDKACISCMRCVSVCPSSARKVNPVLLSAVGLALEKSMFRTERM